MDRKLNPALVRLLEMIGEAAGRATEAERLQRPSIPWHAITGLRNRLIHGYDSVVPDVEWRIVRDDLPPLILDLGNCLPTGNP
ncbi:MAG TPA: HepT-like ribonuclease domain-containing protein [Acidobacteriaceae bacterium]|nr:HepT-like ribonuclease domain-containing protein [Acidobacteriaceae bacterium]